MKANHPVKPAPFIQSVVFLFIALLSFQLLAAQPGLEDKSKQPSSTGKKSYWYHDLRFRFPEFIVDRVFPFRNAAFSSLPYGMDKYMYPTKKEYGFFGPFTNNYSFRLIGLFYKDRIGLELYAGGYGARVDPQPFNDYLSSKFPGRYGSDTVHAKVNDYSFSGLQYGLAYKLHWRGLVVEPKFILGFEKISAPYASGWIFKERGSNQFTEYQVDYKDSSRHQHSYHFQLRLAKRFHIGTNPTWFELGLKTEYISSAKKQLYLHIRDQPYGQPDAGHDLVVQTRYHSFTTGLFFTVYLKNSHIVN